MQLNYFRSQLMVKANVTVKQNEWKQSSLWWLGLMMTFLHLPCDQKSKEFSPSKDKKSGISSSVHKTGEGYSMLSPYLKQKRI